MREAPSLVTQLYYGQKFVEQNMTVSLTQFFQATMVSMAHTF
jgi:hypothetical protein